MTQATETKPFDRDLAELAIQEWMTAKFGGGVEIFESVTDGVMAFERLGYPMEDGIDWDDLATYVSKETGIPVVNLAHTDWSFDDRCDEEATFIALGVPNLPDSYADTYRTVLSAEYQDALDVEAAPAPAL